MPDAAPETVDVIFSFSSGVNLVTESRLSSILSMMYRRKSKTGAAMVI